MTPHRWPAGLLDRHVLGLRAFAIVTPVGIIGVLTVVPMDLPAGDAIRLWLVASIASTAAMGAVMAIAAKACAAMSNTMALRLAVLGSALAAGAARGLAVGISFQGQGVADRASLGVRTLSSAVIFGIWLMLIGALISSSVRYRESRSRLLDELLMRELQARLLDEDRARAQRGDSALRFAETTSMVRGILDDADASATVDYAEISRSIQQAVDERVRPLVHEMWSAPEPEPRDDPSLMPFLRRALLARIPAAWAIGVYGAIVYGAALLSTGGAASPVLDLQTSLIAASAETIAVAAVILAERLMRPTPTPRSRSLLFAGLLVLPLATAWLLTADRVSGDVSVLALGSLVVTAPVIVLASCAAQAALADRVSELADLQHRLDRDEWGEQLQLLERRAADADLASQVHNTMQARLVAAAMQLRTAALQGDEDRAVAALRDARAALDSAGLDHDAPVTPAAERLASIVDAWRGIVDVHVEHDPLATDVPGLRLALDAVEECVANASRHAHATRVDVSLACAGDDLLLTVVDDGEPVGPDAVLGLGTAWMQRVTGDRMVRDRVDGRNRVRLHIPMA